MNLLRSRCTRGGLGVVAACLALAGPASRADDAPYDRGRAVTGTIVDVNGRGIPNVSVFVETDPCCLLEELLFVAQGTLRRQRLCQ